MIDNATAQRITHGSPEGYRLGCRTQGGCANHNDRELLTCADAHRAAHADWSLGRRPADQAITKADVALNRSRTANRPRATAPNNPTSGTPDTLPRQRSESSTPPQATVRPPAKKTNAAASRRKHSNQPREPRQSVHGTVHGHRRGCKTDDQCPNKGTSQPTCNQAHLAYYRDYRARRRAGQGPEPKHGTPSGYAAGCHDRSRCPGSAGITCPEASLAAERKRRRRRGIPAAAALTSADPAREHIALLRGAGMTIDEIAARADIGRTAVRTLIYGRDDYIGGRPGPRHREIPRRIQTAKSAKILAIVAPRKAAS